MAGQYVSTSGTQLTRLDVGQEAIRLSRLVVSKLPFAEPLGLLALMLFHEARAASRVAGDGSLIPLDEQDRSGWDHAMIDEANSLLAVAAEAERPGEYQLQAAIASVHANANRYEDTNWAHIIGLYDGLVELAPTPVFHLNRAVAYGMAHGPAAGLGHVDALEGPDEYHLLHAARADMLRRLGRLEQGYRAALRLARNGSERLYLERRIAECRCAPTG